MCLMRDVEFNENTIQFKTFQTCNTIDMKMQRRKPMGKEHSKIFKNWERELRILQMWWILNPQKSLAYCSKADFLEEGWGFKLSVSVLILVKSDLWKFFTFIHLYIGRSSTSRSKNLTENPFLSPKLVNQEIYW